jgi:hypothetical protein
MRNRLAFSFAVATVLLTLAAAQTQLQGEGVILILRSRAQRNGEKDPALSLASATKASLSSLADDGIGLATTSNAPGPSSLSGAKDVPAVSNGELPGREAASNSANSGSPPSSSNSNGGSASSGSGFGNGSADASSADSSGSLPVVAGPPLPFNPAASIPPSPALPSTLAPPLSPPPTSSQESSRDLVPPSPPDNWQWLATVRRNELLHGESRQMHRKLDTMAALHHLQPGPGEVSVCC